MIRKILHSFNKQTAFSLFRSMQWTDEKEIMMMMREVLGKNVLVHKSGSQERGQGWQKVADTLNPIEGFNLSGRAVRDKIMALIKKHKPLINGNIR